MNQVCVNGTFHSPDEPVLLAANRGYRYGDALFETMKITRGHILLEPYHFNRLLAGLELLKYKIPRTITKEKINQEILALCRKNSCTELGRIRLSVYRGNGGLYDDPGLAGYLIESWPLEESMNRLNENGLQIGIFPDGRKSCDAFAGLKSASFQVYNMAALYAKTQKWNDCLVLNTSGRVADSTIANIFLVKNGKISTPSLAEGCVAGVMREYLLGVLREEGQDIAEIPVSPEDILDADEIFLTNAIRGIRWVARVGEKKYGRDLSVQIYDRFVKTIFT